MRISKLRKKLKSQKYRNNILSILQERKRIVISDFICEHYYDDYYFVGVYLPAINKINHKISFIKQLN